ncbi:MAG: glycosyltransferase family 39 protein [Anaerolineales bacterium]
MSLTRRLVLVVAVLLFLAARVIPSLNDESLWGDEGWSVYFTNGDNLYDVTAAMVEDRHPPLYFWALFGWRGLAGDDEVAMRFLASLASLLAGALLFQLAYRLFDGRAALGGLFFFALLDLQHVFSVEVRHYSPFLLWVTASTLLLIVWIRAPRRGVAFGLVLALVGGLYTHVLMAGVMLWQALIAAGWLLPAAPGRLARLASLYALASLAYIPWIVVGYYQFLVNGGRTPSFPVTWDSAAHFAPQFLGSPLWLGGGLLLVGILSALRPRGRHDRAGVNVAIVALLVPLALVVVLESDQVSLLNDRNLSMLIPFISLLVGLGLARLPRALTPLVVAFMLVHGALTVDADFVSPPWRPISEFVAPHQVPGEPLLRDVGGADAALDYHLRHAGLQDTRMVSLYMLREFPPYADFELYTHLRFIALDGATGFWFISWGEDPNITAAFVDWGFERTATYQDDHLGSPIYMFRYEAREAP